LTEGGLEAVLGQDGIAAFLHDLDRPDGHYVPNWLERPPSPAREALTIQGDRRLVTFYTSGTTGTYQAIHKTASQLFNEARMLLETFQLEAGFHVIATVPSYHIYGLLFGFLLPLLGEGTFEEGTPFFPETIRERAVGCDRGLLVTVPAHLAVLAQLEPGDLAGLQRVFCSTAPLSQQDAETFHERQRVPLIEVFGSTETGGIAWRVRPHEPNWRPLPGIVVTAGEDQRLHLDSPLLSPTESRPSACQDRIELLPSGKFRHLGRMDGIVKIGGKRIAIRHLENTILGLAGVEDVVVVRRKRSGGRNEELQALVATTALSENEIHSALTRIFDTTVLPRRIRVVDALPRTSTGKLELAAVEAQLSRKGGVSSECLFARISPERGHDELGPNEYGFEFVIRPDCPYFEGHFPGYALLPGVAQIHELVLPQVRALRSSWGAPSRLERLKFHKPIRPGDSLRLRLRIDDERLAATFEVDRADELCSSGRIFFSSEDL